MCLLFESIRTENRQFRNLREHINRMNHSVEQIYGIKTLYHESDLKIPDSITDGIYKCRILYDKKIYNIDFQLYKKRIIQKIKIIVNNEVDYSYKFTERKFFETLFIENPGYDEFIIVKNGMVTDSTFSNLALFKEGKWHTPSTYLLNGIKRKMLLRSQFISEQTISLDDLFRYKKIAFINAMLDLEDIQADIMSIVV